MKNFIFIAFTTAMLYGCNDADVKDVLGYPHGRQVHFNASFPAEGNGHSRVAVDGTAWENEDQIGIIASLNLTDVNIFNYDLTENVWTANTSDDIIYVPSSKQSYEAYYPQTFLFNSDNNDITVELSNQFSKTLDEIDFMFASSGETIGSQVNLEFNRQLTKVSFELFETNEPGIDDDLASWTITLNGVATSGNFNMTTGEFDPTTVTTGDITIPLVKDGNTRITYNSATKAYSFDMYLLPHNQTQLSGVSITATKDGVTYTARPSATSSWEAGTANTFAATFGTPQP